SKPVPRTVNESVLSREICRSWNRDREYSLSRRPETSAVHNQERSCSGTAGSPPVRETAYLSAVALLLSPSDFRYDSRTPQVAGHRQRLASLDALLGLRLLGLRRKRRRHCILCLFFWTLYQPLGRDRWRASRRSADSFGRRVEL